MHSRNMKGGGLKMPVPGQDKIGIELQRRKTDREAKEGRDKIALRSLVGRGAEPTAGSSRDLNQSLGLAQAQEPDSLDRGLDGTHLLKREFHTGCVSKTHCQLLGPLVLRCGASSFLGHAGNKQTVCQGNWATTSNEAIEAGINREQTIMIPKLSAG